MAIISLSEVQNDYGSYRGNSLIGERGTAVTVPNDGLEGIVGKPYPFLNGVILEIEGTLYTDQGYLNALKAAGNPYISKRSLPVVSFKLNQLTELVPDIEVYKEDGEPVYRTQYAEANVTKRMSTIDDVLFYLNDFFNPNTTDTVLEPGAIGSFNLGTTTYSPDLDVNGLYPGLEFETLEDIKSATTVKISTPPTQTEPKKPEPKIEVKVPEEKPLSVVVPQQVIEIKQKLPGGLPITSETPAVFTEVTGPNAQLARTLSAYQTGNTYGYVNTGVIEPTKPTGTGNYTGEARTAADGSKWVWIPFQGGWTKA